MIAPLLKSACRSFRLRKVINELIVPKLAAYGMVKLRGFQLEAVALL